MTDPAVRAALDAGDLLEAQDRQRAGVAAGPTPAGRLLLAELYAVAGDTAAARVELDRIESAAPDWPASRRQFARTLAAAGQRAAFRRTRFTHPEPWHLRARWRAAKLVHGGDLPRAARWIDRADGTALALAGHVDGREFSGLRDCDDVTGSVLELFAGGRYLWAAWEQLRRVRLRPAVGVLDAVFRPADITFHDGRTFAVTLPLVYAGSAGVDGAFTLGLDTDFAGGADGPVRGVGGRLLMFGDDEVRLADVRQIDLVKLPE